ncbi:MAG: hypothetical protein QW728_04490, partial [Thermoplasmata archaeon]
SLYASNISYRKMNYSIAGPIQEKLEKLEFAFNLTAKKVQVRNRPYPVIEVTVAKDGNSWKIKDSKFVEKRTYNGTAMNYDVKFDQLIEGWDFQSDNTAPRLVMEVTSAIANRAGPGIMAWANFRYEKLIQNCNGTAKVDTEGGLVEANESNALQNEDISENAPTDIPKKVKPNSPKLEFADEVQRVGYLTWVSNVSVTRNGENSTEQMYFQIQGFRAFSFYGPAGAKYVGFACLGGISYPAGERIFHDPNVGGEALSLSTQDIPEIKETTKRTFFPVIILPAAVAAVAAVYVIRRRA